MTTPTLPKITVVTPVLNGAANLRDTILSIVEQQYPNLEYIVVDGGSTDGSLDIIREYDAHVTRLIQGKDRTMYDAVAKGFDAGTGDVFCWLNSDDMFTPGILLRVGRLFAEHADWHVVHGDDTVWKQGWHVAHRPQRPVQLPELIMGHVIPQASTFFRADAYRAVGGLEREALKLAADYQLWVRLAAKYELHYLDAHASVFRIRPKQLSGDWEAYTREMAAVAAGAMPYLPADYLKRTRRARLRRTLASRRQVRRRRFLYPLRDERLNWPPIVEPPRQPLHTCRCPACGGYPRRLLFSAPDTRHGDRRLWRIYHCTECDIAFRFPRPSAADSDEVRASARAAAPEAPADVPAGVYSPFRSPSLLGGLLRTTLGGRYDPADVAASADDDKPLIDLPQTAELIAFGDGTLDYLKRRGFANARVGGGDDGPADAVVLGQALQHVDEPVAFLDQLRGRLKPDGQIRLAMPNLDSHWLARYGPCWSQWHPPFHAVHCGRRGLARLAERVGLRVAWTRTTTPRRWLYLSEKLAVLGLAGQVSDDFTGPVDRKLWTAVTGAVRLGRLTTDPRGRGDCLHACLVAR